MKGSPAEAGTVYSYKQGTGHSIKVSLLGGRDVSAGAITCCLPWSPQQEAGRGDTAGTLNPDIGDMGGPLCQMPVLIEVIFN